MRHKGFGLISLILTIGIILIISASVYFWTQSATQSLNLGEPGQENKSIPEKLDEIREEVGGETSLVSDVIDGDTIEIMGGQRIRYIGIDAPETADPAKPAECFGKEATDKNRELIEGKRVKLEGDVSNSDEYGRLLRYVRVSGTFVNDYLIRQGYARAYDYPPDSKYSVQFAEAEKEAKENNRGLWANCK